MDQSVNTQEVIEGVLYGTLGENFCFVCLSVLDGYSENIFTEIHKKDFSFSVAEILNKVCNIQVPKTDVYNVCYDCFNEASIAYKFYLKSKQSEEIFGNYMTELRKQVCLINLDSLMTDEFVCVSLNTHLPVTTNFTYNIANIDLYRKDHECKREIAKEKQKSNKNIIAIKEEQSDENIVMFTHDSGLIEFYRIASDGSLVQLGEEELDGCKNMLDNIKAQQLEKNNIQVNKIKRTYKIRNERKKRKLMTYKICSECPVRYRYSAKLKEHMKSAHNIDLFICRVCKALFEDEGDFCIHLRTHTNIYTCDVCNVVFKKRDTIMSHLRRHEEMASMGTKVGAHVCELCGHVLPNKESLEDHYDKKHYKKYMCFYCGKSYKGEISFEAHIQKHEKLKSKNKDSNESEVNTHWLDPCSNESSIASFDTIQQHQQQVAPVEDARKSRDAYCEQCNRNFVDARALLWHKRLHTNEKPYACDVCGKSFVTVNRRNQHMLCAHSAPTRRCPLCPALFHLRSMVNSHIRKVHLNFQKRRNRVSKHHQVHWRTEPVPIQELSISVQNELLEMRTKDLPIV